VYAAGNELPVFTVGDLTFGILICDDFNYYYSPRYSTVFQLRRLDGEPANFFSIISPNF
jgi:predicted amidohydrolase